MVERLNWLADTSANGFRQSYAMMVNYRYKLADVDANHEAYATRQDRRQPRGAGAGEGPTTAVPPRLSTLAMRRWRQA